MASQPEYTPTIITPSHTSTTPSESFSTPSRGQCTWHTLISSTSTPSSSLSAGIAVCPPKTGSLCPHRHSHAEIYHILSGKGLVTIEGKDYVVEAGCTVFVPGDAEHGVLNKGEEELRWLYVFAADRFEDVIYRFTDEAEEETKPENPKTEVKKVNKEGGSTSFWKKLKIMLG